MAGLRPAATGWFVSKAVTDSSWPLARLGEGMDELARLAGLHGHVKTPANAPKPLQQQDVADLERWIQWAGEQIGLEAESIECTLPQVGNLLCNAAPAILRIGNEADSRFVLLLKAKFGKCRLLAPDLSVRSCKVETLRGVLCERYEAPIGKAIERFLAQADLPRRRRQKVSALMLDEQLASQRMAGCWMLRLPPSANFWQQLSEAKLPARVVTIAMVFCLLYGLEIGGWGLIGQAALNGRLDFGWLSAWALLVFSLIPLQLLASWLDSRFALDFGGILKKRLLAGALRLDLDVVKHQGAGQLLGRVMESQALESLALNGGFSVLIAGIELLFSGWILANGAGGGLHVVLMLAWLALAVGLCWRYFHRLRSWTLMRLDLTYELVERMVGHRTCLAQEPASRRDAGEDRQLNEYLNIAKQSDDALVPIMGGLSRGWLIIAIMGLAPGFIAGTGSSTALAISLGGILLANRALSGIAGGLAAISRAAIAWRQVSVLFHAAESDSPKPAFLTTRQIDAHGMDEHGKLIAAGNLVYRYQAQGDPVLRGVDLAIYKGERILLEGASGGGKSTLASLLVGLRAPDAGLLLLNGLDRFTLGETWHQMATEAPQFHENHILSGTLAFNLLMGRNWPASEQDIEQAKALCGDLGLGELLERMPSGLQQMVGETGWQLSHGERSRIFLARALLQNTQLTILDESFAALDPESMKKCLNCAFEQANTLLVIAHP